MLANYIFEKYRKISWNVRIIKLGQSVISEKNWNFWSKRQFKNFKWWIWVKKMFLGLKWGFWKVRGKFVNLRKKWERENHCIKEGEVVNLRNIGLKYFSKSFSKGRLRAVDLSRVRVLGVLSWWRGVAQPYCSVRLIPKRNDLFSLS